MGRDIPSHREVKSKLDQALVRLLAEDGYLLEHDLNERTISHKLAMHLQCEFRDWNVDVEYNRDHDRVKSVRLLPETLESNDTDAKTVFPDIIVHRQGGVGDGDNLVVIEVKKSGRNADRDRSKLRGYLSDLGYKHAALVWITVGLPTPEPSAPEWICCRAANAR